MESAKKFVCSKDGRRFATKAALDQHMSVKHGGGAKPKAKAKRNAQPKSGPSLSVKQGLVVKNTQQVTRGDSSRASGTDVLLSLNVSASQKPMILARIALNPSLMEDTRLAQVASLWDRWRPNRVTLSVQAAVPSVSGGQCMIAWTSDHDHKMPPDALGRMRSAAAMQPSKIFHLWERASITPQLAPQQKWLWVDHQQGADSYYGVFYILLTGTPSMMTGSFNLTCTLDWDVTFDTPQLTEFTEEAVVQADTGYFPYFTTYTSHLTLTDRMTLQENSNGGYSSIVKFSEMEADMVYTPMKADQLRYYDGSGNLKSVGALVRMKEVTEPFVWCFADTTHAFAYIRDGTTSYILGCNKAGPWCDGNPNWKRADTSVAMFDNRLGYAREAAKPGRVALKTDPALKQLISSLVSELRSVVENTNHVREPENPLQKGIPVVNVALVSGSQPLLAEPLLPCHIPSGVVRDSQDQAEDNC